MASHLAALTFRQASRTRLSSFGRLLKRSTDSETSLYKKRPDPKPFPAFLQTAKVPQGYIPFASTLAHDKLHPVNEDPDARPRPAPRVPTEVDKIRNRIFGTLLTDGLKSGRKWLAKPLVGHTLNNYYLPTLPVNSRGSRKHFTHDDQVVRLEKLAYRRSMGKLHPKKGAGKRAKGGKKK